MEIFAALGAYLVFAYVIGFVVTLLLGSVLDLAVPGFRGLLWRNSVLALAATVGMAVAFFIPFPFNSLVFPGIGITIVLVTLYDMDFAEEFRSIVAFILAFGICSWIASFTIIAALASGG